MNLNTQSNKEFFTESNDVKKRYSVNADVRPNVVNMRYSVDEIKRFNRYAVDAVMRKSVDVINRRAVDIVKRSNDVLVRSSVGINIRSGDAIRRKSDDADVRPLCRAKRVINDYLRNGILPLVDGVCTGKSCCLICSDN